MEKNKNFWRGLTKKKKAIIILTVIVALTIAFFVFGSNKDVEYVTAKVEKGDLKQTVSEVGTVKAVKEINLSFLQSGRLGNNFVEIGDKVEEEQVLAELNYSSLLIKQKEAEANLEVARANLEKLLAGATFTEVKVSQASVQQAEAAYNSALEELEKNKNTVEENISQAQQTLNDLLSDSPADVTPYEYAVTTAKTNLDKTINTYTQYVYNYQDTALSTMNNKLAVANTALDQVHQILNDRDIMKVFSSRDYFYLNSTEITYEESLDLLDVARSNLEIAQETLNDDDISQALSDSLNCLNKVFDCLNYCYEALEETPPASYFTETQIEAKKTTISTHLTNISTGISAVQTAYQNLVDAILTYDSKVSAAEDNLETAETNLEDAIKNARNTLSSAKISGEQTIAAAEAKVSNTLENLNYASAQLDKVKSPARSQEVSLYQAQVKQAEASRDLIEQQIEDSIIKSPIDGTVTKINYEPGEQVAAGQPVVSVLGTNNFEVEIDISEADISKINIDDEAEITLDAFGEDIVFNGVVSFIEPAETVIQDVIYYKVKIQFTEEGDLDQSYYNDIKSGMTANATITTAEKENILFVPNRAVLEKDDLGKYVRVLEDGEIKEISVKIGLRGDGGKVEILSGLEEGQEIVTFIREIK